MQIPYCGRRELRLAFHCSKAKHGLWKCRGGVWGGGGGTGGGLDGGGGSGNNEGGIPNSPLDLITVTLLADHVDETRVGPIDRTGSGGLLESTSLRSEERVGFVGMPPSLLPPPPLPQQPSPYLNTLSEINGAEAVDDSSTSVLRARLR